MTELFIGLKNKDHIITEKQEDSQMAKKETHIPAIIDTPEALEAKIAAMKEAQKLFATYTQRSEERRVGKECSEPCRSRWSPYH